jgi:hypothetical protein
MHLSFFPAFFDHPEQMSFAQQESDEKIELLLRQHWVTNLPWLISAFIAVFVPFAVVSWSPYFGLPFLTQIPNSIWIAAILLWYLLIIAFVIESFLYWYFNIYIVTDQHLVDIDFHSLLLRDVTEASLDNIESAKSTIKGITRSMFNYGDVVISTAAEHQDITFDGVPYPDRVADRINDLKERRI